MRRAIFLLTIVFLLAGCLDPTGFMVRKDFTKTDTLLNAPDANPAPNSLASKATQITFTFDEPVIITKFTVDGVDKTLTTTNKKTFVSDDTFGTGKHTVELYAKDASGNEAGDSYFFTVDSGFTVDVMPKDKSTIYDKDVEIEFFFSRPAFEAVATLDGKPITLTPSADKKIYVHKTTVEEGKYRLSVSAEDEDGNKISSDTVFTYSLDSDTDLPAKVTGFTATLNDEGTKAILKWDPNSDSDFARYEIFKDDAGLSSVNNLNAYKKITSSTSTTTTVLGLTNQSYYCFTIRVVDTSGNAGPIATDQCVIADQRDRALPIISDFRPTGTIYGISHPVNFSTNEDARCKGSVEDDVVYDSMSYTFDDDFAKTHSATVGVSVGTDRKIFIRCKDQSGNIMTDSFERTWDVEASSTTSTDTTAPSVSISAPTADTVYPDGTISFSHSTNEGTCQYSVNNTANSSMVSSMTLPNGTFTVKVWCTDSSGNVGSSAVSFAHDTVVPALIDGLQADADASGGAVDLSWSYSAPTDFKQYNIYQETSTILSVSGLTPIATISQSTTTAYEATGLTNGIEYFFAVAVLDNADNKNNTVVDVSATPTDTIAPTISNVVSSSITATGATITWDTDESANSTVFYGTGAGSYTDSTTEIAFVTSHFVTLGTLTTATTYYYLVSSWDESGNAADNSSEYNFTTA